MKDLLFKVEKDGTDIIVNGIFIDKKGKLSASINGKDAFYCSNVRYNTKIKDHLGDNIFEGDEVLIEDMNENPIIKGKVIYVEGNYCVDNGTDMTSLFSENGKITSLNKSNEKDVEIFLLKQEIKKLEKEISSLRKSNEVIVFNGENYELTQRLAQKGDVIMFPKVHHSWDSSIQANVPYRVVKSDSVVSFMDNDGNRAGVYGSYKGYDDEDSVKVYKKVIK